MAQPGVPTRQMASEKFVESCGAILFDLTTNPRTPRVCLVQARAYHEWHLAKGRRNCGESRKDAALREVMEETGFRCHLFPVTMPTRATPPDTHPDIDNKARIYDNLTEPFMCTIRELKRPKPHTKIIWWYIAALDDPDESVEKLPGESKWIPEFFPYAEAITTLTYQGDRDLVTKAFGLVNATLARKQALDGVNPNESNGVIGNTMVDVDDVGNDTDEVGDDANKTRTDADGPEEEAQHEAQAQVNLKKQAMLAIRQAKRQAKKERNKESRRMKKKAKKEKRAESLKGEPMNG